MPMPLPAPPSTPVDAQTEAIVAWAARRFRKCHGVNVLACPQSSRVLRGVCKTALTALKATGTPQKLVCESLMLPGLHLRENLTTSKVVAIVEKYGPGDEAAAHTPPPKPEGCTKGGRLAKPSHKVVEKAPPPPVKKTDPPPLKKQRLTQAPVPPSVEKPPPPPRDFIAPISSGTQGDEDIQDVPDMLRALSTAKPRAMSVEPAGTEVELFAAETRRRLGALDEQLESLKAQVKGTDGSGQRWAAMRTHLTGMLRTIDEAERDELARREATRKSLATIHATFSSVKEQLDDYAKKLLDEIRLSRHKAEERARRAQQQQIAALTRTLMATWMQT